MARPNSVESIHSRIFHACNERIRELGCSPKGIMFVFGIRGPAGVDIDVEQIYFTFKNHFRFVLLIEEDLTFDVLQAFIEAAATYKYPIGSNYIGFYFSGHGKLDQDSRPAFMVVPTSTEISQPRTWSSLQKDILDCFIKKREEKKEKERYMFFFDCCLSYPKHHTFNVSHLFAFDTPPQCIVSFATSPFLKSSGNSVNGGLWTSHFCEYLAKMDRGHTLTQVLDVTNDVMMRYSEFKQPPQYRSCTGPIYLKGLHPLLYSFMKHKENLVDLLQDDDITIVSLTAIFHSKSIIDEATKTEILKYKGEIGARILLLEVGKTCRASDVAFTEMMVQIMHKQPELKQVIDKIYKERKNYDDPTSEELLEKIKQLETDINVMTEIIKEAGPPNLINYSKLVI